MKPQRTATNRNESQRTATNRNEGASESLRVVALRSASCASETFMSDSSACEKHSDASGFVEQFFLRVVQVVSYNALNPGTARSPPSIQAFHVLSLHGVARNRVGARELHCFTMMEWQCPATFGVSHARCRTFLRRAFRLVQHRIPLSACDNDLRPHATQPWTARSTPCSLHRLPSRAPSHLCAAPTRPQKPLEPCEHAVKDKRTLAKNMRRKTYAL